MVAVACYCQRQGQLAKLLLKSTTQYLKHPCEHEYSTPILYLSPATTDKTNAYEITVVNTARWLIHITKKGILWEGWREKQSQVCISGGNFQKKHIFWKDFLQASKPRRGRELIKDRPYVHMYIRLCKFCHKWWIWSAQNDARWGLRNKMSNTFVWKNQSITCTNLVHYKTTSMLQIKSLSFQIVMQYFTFLIITVFIISFMHSAIYLLLLVPCWFYTIWVNAYNVLLQSFLQLMQWSHSCHWNVIITWWITSLLDGEWFNEILFCSAIHLLLLVPCWFYSIWVLKMSCCSHFCNWCNDLIVAIEM